jgi:RNA polymerase sigma-70 factor, ECF subfamily
MTEPPEASYTDLISAILSEDHQAFEQLVEKSHRLVRKVAAPLLPAWAVDDAVQETYIVVYQKLHHLREPEAFPGWLSRIALNVCYQWRRKKEKTSELKHEHATAEHATAEPTTAELTETGVDLRSALAKLSGKERNVMILREYIGLSYEEISRAVNVPIGTVRSRLSKAREKIRKLLL